MIHSTKTYQQGLSKATGHTLPVREKNHQKHSNGMSSDGAFRRLARWTHNNPRCKELKYMGETHELRWNTVIFPKCLFTSTSIYPKFKPNVGKYSIHGAWECGFGWVLHCVLSSQSQLMSVNLVTSNHSSCNTFSLCWISLLNLPTLSSACFSFLHGISRASCWNNGART